MNVNIHNQGNDLYRVYLDGSILDDCCAADEECGKVVVSRRENGNLVIVNDEVQRETLFGSVRIEKITAQNFMDD